MLCFCLLLRRPQISPLFPYTTLFRSRNRRYVKGTADSGGQRNSKGPICSIGFLNPRRLRGRSLSSAATQSRSDRKSTRLNSSHRCISYAVFCLKKKINRCLVSDAVVL